MLSERGQSEYSIYTYTIIYKKARYCANRYVPSLNGNNLLLSRHIYSTSFSMRYGKSMSL